MSWLFSRALVALSAGTCSDGERSAPSNVTPTPQVFSSPGKTTVACNLSRYGMTSEPLTADRGEALLTWFRAAFRAKSTAEHLEGRRVAEDLWPEYLRIVADVAPSFVSAENVTRKAIDAAADDLEALGYSVRCIAISAADMGADHIRQRYWLRAYADSHRQLRVRVDAEVAQLPGVRPRVWETEPDESRMADGVAHWVDRLEATGNGQVPAVAATAWRLLGGR